MELPAGLLASMKLMKGVGGGGVESLRGAVTQAGSCQQEGGWGVGVWRGSCHGKKDSWPFWAPEILGGAPRSGAPLR